MLGMGVSDISSIPHARSVLSWSQEAGVGGREVCLSSPGAFFLVF